jgi:hypothetical protein
MLQVKSLIPASTKVKHTHTHTSATLLINTKREMRVYDYTNLYDCHVTKLHYPGHKK